MSLKDCFLTSQEPPSPLTLEIKGLGHIPSKKNHHFPLKSGGLGIDKPVKERLERVTKALEFGLLSAFRTTSNGTWTAAQLRSWIASCLPADDSWQHVPSIMISAHKCAKGEEGATIEIVELT